MKIDIPGSGSIFSEILLLGEGGGFEEFKQKKPFVGRAGKLLRKECSLLNYNFNKIYITNIVKFRPYDIFNRNIKPSLEDIREQSILLLNEIRLLKYLKIIITLGSTAINSLLKYIFYYIQDDIKISYIRGNILCINKLFICPTFHPAFILRNQSKLFYLQNDLKKFYKLYCKL